MCVFTAVHFGMSHSYTILKGHIPGIILKNYHSAGMPYLRYLIGRQLASDKNYNIRAGQRPYQGTLRVCSRQQLQEIMSD